MLWDFKDVKVQTYENAMSLFTLNIDSNNYFVTIKTLMSHHFAIKYVCIGIALKLHAIK